MDETIATSTEAEPPYLYHYTKQVGLLGIVRESALWATHVRYLNDSSEIAYSFSLAEKALAEREQESTDFPAIRGEFYARLQSTFFSELDNPLYVVSFSEHGDLLSQWRAYCAPGDAFSIGFPTPVLQQACRRVGWLLQRCIYDAASAQRVMRTIIAQHERALPKVEGMIVHGHALACTRDLVQAGCFVKHPSFSEEQEWRAVYFPNGNLTLDLAFRHGRWSIVPYTRLKLQPPPHTKAALIVCVGPSPYPHLAANAASTLVRDWWPGSVVWPTESSYRER